MLVELTRSQALRDSRESDYRQVCPNSPGRAQRIRRHRERVQRTIRRLRAIYGFGAEDSVR